MAYVTSRKNPNNEILLLFSIPFYTSSRIYYEEDLEQLGLDRVLDGVAPDLRRTILDHARTLSNVQPELAFHFLLTFPQLLQRIRVEDLAKWASVALDIYDSHGLEAARDFVLGMDSHPDFRRHWGRGGCRRRCRRAEGSPGEEAGRKAGPSPGRGEGRG